MVYALVLVEGISLFNYLIYCSQVFFIFLYTPLFNSPTYSFHSAMHFENMAS